MATTKKKRSTPAPEAETRVEYMRLSELTPAPRNPKEHAEEDIRASITRFGFVGPFILNERTGLLVAGHGRLKVARQLEAAGGDTPLRVKLGDDGQWLFPVLRGISFRNDEEAEAYLLADNRLGEKGGYDEAMLSEMLQDIVGQDLSLDGIGFDGEELQRLLAMDVHPLDADEAEERGRNNSGALKDVTSTNGVVKTVPIYMEPSQHQLFIEKVKQLGDVWDLDNVSAIVLKAVAQVQS